MPKTVMIFAAHPDDVEYSAGGTVARMIREGARAIGVIASDGCRGSFELDGETLVAVRAEEARRAAKVMGAEPPVLLGHPDLELDRLEAGLLREQFIRLIREHHPDVVIAHDPFAPYEPHPDHRAVGWAASDALAFSPLPLVHPEHLADGLDPHFVPEKYFFSDPPATTNKVVDTSETMAAKMAALAEHKSQVRFLVEDVIRQGKLAGLDLRAILGEALDDPLAALTWAMEAQAAEVGQRIGVAFGEAFRYARFHPFVENLLQGLDSG